MSAKRLKALQERKTALLAKAREAAQALDAEGLADDDVERLEEEYQGHMASISKLGAQIEREQQLMDEELTATALEIPDDAVITGGQPRVAHDPKRGFKSFGEFATAVANVGLNRGFDERLNIAAAAPGTYGNEASGADGGFAVPPEYGREIWQMSLEEDSFLPMTDNMPITGNSMVFPSDETTPWGTDGVRAYWENEAAAATQTKPKLNPNTMRLKKLMALVPVSDELLSDASGLPAYLNRKVAESIRWKTNDAIINGDGVGKPLGILEAGALVTQAKKSGQAADTIVAENVVNMFARLINPGRGVWLVNPDAYPQLPLMTIGDQPVYIAPNGLQSAPGGTLLGRPVILTDVCKTLGDLGDIQFVNFSMYRTLTKAGGIETATSMHLYFDAAATAFRSIFRIDGQPVLKDAVTPPNSAKTRSGYVTLAERA